MPHSATFTFSRTLIPAISHLFKLGRNLESWKMTCLKHSSLQTCHLSFTLYSQKAGSFKCLLDKSFKCNNFNSLRSDILITWNIEFNLTKMSIPYPMPSITSLKSTLIIAFLLSAFNQKIFLIFYHISVNFGP